MIQNRSIEEYLKDPLGILKPTENELHEITNQLVSFIQGYFKFYSFNKAVVGLSGGIDSTMIAHLCVKALGEGRVYGVMLPSKYTSALHIENALKTCKKLQIEYNDFDIVHEYFDDALEMLQNMGERSSNENIQKQKAGNIQARMRMILLRDIAKQNKGLVVGTTNKTEMMLGYATVAGDGLGGIDIEPIADLYKTTLRHLASFWGVPQDIIDQTPTAELWDGQTDESELGISYRLADQILWGIEQGVKDEDIVRSMKKDNIEVEDINNIKEIIKTNSFKNKLPATAKIYE